MTTPFRITGPGRYMTRHGVIVPDIELVNSDSNYKWASKSLGRTWKDCGMHNLFGLGEWDIVAVAHPAPEPARPMFAAAKVGDRGGVEMETLLEKSMFAVEVTRIDGTTFLASEGSGLSLSFLRKDAGRWRDELAGHIPRKRMKIIPVKVKIMRIDK